MLRINLLPAYIEERKKTRNVIIGVVAGVLAVIAALSFYTWGVLSPAVAAQQAAADEQEKLAKEVQTIQADAENILAEAKPITDKSDYVKQVRFYNTLRQNIYRRVAQYTYKEIEYSAMTAGGQTLQLSAYAKKLSDVGRFYIQLFGNPDLSAVSISGIPGWPKGQAGGGGGGGRGFPGGGGGGGYPGAGGPPGGSGGYPGAGGGIPASGGADQNGLPQGASPGDQQLAQGVPIAVTATLIKPISRPALPGSGGGAGGGGGFGGPGGYPGAGGGFTPPAAGGYPGGGGAVSPARTGGKGGKGIDD